jgi:D-arabinose 1-dehydrogenase-like Zn-dependent alcohol dehydrogenase
VLLTIYLSQPRFWRARPRGGTAKDSQDTLEFSAVTGVHSMIQKYPLSRVAEAYEQMHSGKVRFRVVLTMGA